MKNTLLHKAKTLLSYILIISAGLGIGIGAKYGLDLYNQQPNLISQNTNPHYKGVDSKVIIYTTQWCPYCKKAKQYLTDNSIDYIERDIESGSEEINRLYKSIGYPGVPKIVIGNKIINGFNESLLSNVLSSQDLL
ncbi:glutaredoxin family protein [Shewanella violacea]|uniref:Glutaredoxin family protein n=1 Tax=Shewanella violacea (strain JCM 10179 / CIP 106290 / LMG 19151 / DSS12) TaxID=637905 RepID=D4ZBX8_SHEVD|nr:glutaredoxin domain-containing protein [Shewanella violacea]BAJ03523.1 glutaredoxin family protein [Shewanella violacea DSS12]